jgi:glycosyltransferase involved in cell wall biosynthesis
VFVFPSRTDTFGIVMIEAMASGLPVAAYPVPGPIDVVGPSSGVLDEDLRAACLKALTLSREDAREHSMRFTWKESARQFLENIEASRSAVKVSIAPSPGAVRSARAAENR